MKKITLFILAFILVQTSFVCSLTVSDFMTNLKENPQNYYVLYDNSYSGLNPIVTNFASSLNLPISTTILDNKNLITFIVSPSYFGYFYNYESEFSYIELKSNNNLNSLVIYFSPSSDIITNANFVSNSLLTNPNSMNYDFFLIDNNKLSAATSTVTCEGFVNTSIYEKNTFIISGTTYEDQCYDNSTLLKLKCDSGLSTESVRCYSGCSNGACINQRPSIDIIISSIKRWIAGDKTNSINSIVSAIKSWLISR